MIDWPSTLCPIGGGYSPFVRSLSGGQSLSGFEQVQSQMHDRWSAMFTFNIRSRDQIFTLRSTLAQLRGRAGTIRLPSFEKARAPFGGTLVNPSFHKRLGQFVGMAYEYSDITALTGTATITSGSEFSFAASSLVVPVAGIYITLAGVKRRLNSVTGSGPYVCRFTPSLASGSGAPLTITATLNASAALNATSVDIHITAGGVPAAGHFFSIVDRLHQINTVSVLSAGIYRCSIWPWLRAAETSGTSVNFNTPRCEMRLSSDGEGAEALRSLTLRRFGEISIQFDEASAT